MDMLHQIPGFDWINETQTSFHSLPVLDWHAEHMDVPVLGVSAYLVLVFSGPEFMKERRAFQLRPLFAAWNLFLAIFSMIGAYHMVPALFHRVQTVGFHQSVCASPEWYFEGPVGFWLAVFIYSKFAELFDTAFLVLRKKNVIFLHWFHHVTVLLYCWHAYHVRIGAGIWFACMNYVVHSIMYTYYFMTNIGLFRLVQPFAMLITTVQIAQMLGGLAVLLYVARTVNASGVEGTCFADAANWKLGIAMYFSYLVLFVMLFVQKYVSGSSSSRTGRSNLLTGKPKNLVSCPPDVFGDGDDVKQLDASGFFHSQESINSLNEESKRGESKKSK